MSVQLKEIELEYIYVTIPAEYICVYHRILAMLADYGEDMLKDCKASCKDRNSNVIDCFNMFNAAVAARKLGKDKLAETIIKYVKAKINQIYKGKDNSTSFVFPVDENGQLKAFVSCGERPKFLINPEDGELYEHKFNNGFDEHFRLGPEDDREYYEDAKYSDGKISYKGLTVYPDIILGKFIGALIPKYEEVDGVYHPCADVILLYGDTTSEARPVNINITDYQYYFDDIPVIRFNDVVNLEPGVHKFTVVSTYEGETIVINKELEFNPE